MLLGREKLNSSKAKGSLYVCMHIYIHIFIHVSIQDGFSVAPDRVEDRKRSTVKTSPRLDLTYKKKRNPPETGRKIQKGTSVNGVQRVPPRRHGDFCQTDAVFIKNCCFRGSKPSAITALLKPAVLFPFLSSADGVAHI